MSLLVFRRLFVHLCPVAILWGLHIAAELKLHRWTWRQWRQMVTLFKGIRIKRLNTSWGMSNFSMHCTYSVRDCISNSFSLSPSHQVSWHTWWSLCLPSGLVSQTRDSLRPCWATCVWTKPAGTPCSPRHRAALRSRRASRSPAPEPYLREAHNPDTPSPTRCGDRTTPTAVAHPNTLNHIWVARLPSQANHWLI